MELINASRSSRKNNLFPNYNDKIIIITMITVFDHQVEVKMLPNIADKHVEIFN